MLRIGCRSESVLGAALAIGWVLVGTGERSCQATEFHLDPVHGDPANPGTAKAPWTTLQAVAAADHAFAPGDVLVLHSGYHGAPVLRGVNDGEVVVRPAPNARPTVQRLSVRAARNWRVQDLAISPTATEPFERVQLVFIGADASDIVLENCHLYTVPDAADWSASDWDTRACSGIDVRGPNNTIRSNLLQNVNFGISVTGASNVVSHNTIENFSGDGLRGLGDYGVFEYNVVKNCYDVNDNHDDGFQSWSVGPDGVGTGVVRGVVLRGNRIVNYTHPDQPHRGALQGIGCFDGFFEDWLIVNNEILTDHWHGISLGGARNCRILNNTVVDLNSTSPGPPWIQIGNHKDGRPSTGNLVRNNLATDYSVVSGSAVEDHNLEVLDPSAFFRDYPAGDLRLRNGSPAIDVGSPEDAPAVDARGLPRPLDGNADGEAAWDLGAHEYPHGQTDADSDGMSDAAEAVAGTSPTDPDAVLRLSVASPRRGEIRLSWSSAIGRVYDLMAQQPSDAGSWVEVPAAIGLRGNGQVLATTLVTTTAPGEVLRLTVDLE